MKIKLNLIALEVLFKSRKIVMLTISIEAFINQEGKDVRVQGEKYFISRFTWYCLARANTMTLSWHLIAKRENTISGKQANRSCLKENQEWFREMASTILPSISKQQVFVLLKCWCGWSGRILFKNRTHCQRNKVLPLTDCL